MKPVSNGNLDSRQSSGYGRTSARFHKNRTRGSHFPYVNPDQLDDMEDVSEPSPESSKALNIKIPDTDYVAMDPNDAQGTDHFYFAAGNTKLSDCFYRIDSILNEVEVASNSMASVPGMYRDKDVLFGTQEAPAMYIKDLSVKRQGTLKGWSQAPAPIVDDNTDPHPNTLQDLIDLLVKEE
jgi:hypothetical protein